MKLIDSIKNVFNKKDVEIDDNDAIMNVWVCGGLTIAFLGIHFLASSEQPWSGSYNLWRGLIKWKCYGEANHDIFKQNVNYQFKDDKLLITWDDKSFEFRKKGK